MRKYFPLLVIIILSCNTVTKNENSKTGNQTNESLPVNDTLVKIKNLIDTFTGVSNFTSLPNNLTIFPKHYFDSTSVYFLTNKLKEPIDLCYTLNHDTLFTSTSGTINGKHLYKLHPKGNFEIAYMRSADLYKREIDTLHTMARDTFFLSAEIILFTNYPLKCKQDLFVGFLTGSSRIPILKNIKVGDNFKTIINKLGYSYLKFGNVLFYHDWDNTIAKFVIKDNLVNKISVVRYDINLANDSLPTFILNEKMIPEREY